MCGLVEVVSMQCIERGEGVGVMEKDGIEDDGLLKSSSSL